MSNLYITVFVDAKEVAVGYPLQEDVVTYTTSSVQSSALGASPDKKRWRRMRLFSDADCFVTWGEDPTAKNDGTDGRPMVANTPEYFAIESGHKVAVIQRS